jgi:predicted amidophosphoribosyltransferase
MVRLARRTVRALRRSGWPAVCGHCLAALPKADSSHLSAEERAVAATSAFRVRAGRVRRVRAAADAGALVIVVDDILTTGSTMAAVTTALQTAGVTVAGGATIAATRRRMASLDRVRIPHSCPDVGIST